MKSSFKKVEKSTSNKAYFGHPDLDAIFNNSLTKGHLIILEEDHPTTNYLSLLRYYVSSQYHQKIPSLIYDFTPSRWNHLISPKKTQNKEVAQKNTKSQIAWRYDKMEMNQSELVRSEQVQYLDLAKELQQIDQQLIHSFKYPNCSLHQFYQQIESDFLNCHEDGKDTRTKKILLSSLPSYFYNDQKFAMFLHAVRCLVRTSHATILVSIPSIISQSIRKTLLIYCDYYLQIGKVSQGYDDFNSVMGILKQVQCCQIRSKYRGVGIWGIKNKKKELRIEQLYETAIREDGTMKEYKEDKIDF